MRISNSFSEGEIQVMEFILQSLLRGSSPTMATRNKDFASLYRKVMSMRTRLDETKKEGRERPAPAKSSAGEVAAPADVPRREAV